MGGIPYQSTVSDLALDANALSFAAAALGLALGLALSASAFAASALVTLTTLDLSRSWCARGRGGAAHRGGKLYAMRHEIEPVVG